MVWLIYQLPPTTICGIVGVPFLKCWALVWPISQQIKSNLWCCMHTTLAHWQPVFLHSLWKILVNAPSWHGKPSSRWEHFSRMTCLICKAFITLTAIATTLPRPTLLSTLVIITTICLNKNTTHVISFIVWRLRMLVGQTSHFYCVGWPYAWMLLLPPNTMHMLCVWVFNFWHVKLKIIFYSNKTPCLIYRENFTTIWTQGLMPSIWIIIC